MAKLFGYKGVSIKIKACLFSICPHHIFEVSMLNGHRMSFCELAHKYINEMGELDNNGGFPEKCLLSEWLDEWKED